MKQDKSSSSPPQQSLTKMAGIIAVGRFISLLIAIILPLLLVRIFDQNTFGLYKLIFLISETLIPLLEFNFGKSVFYFFPRYQDMKKSILLNIIIIYLITGGCVLVVFTLYPEVAAVLVKGQAIVDFLPYIGVYVVLTLLTFSFEDVIIANGEVTLSSVVVVLTTLLRTAFIITAVLVTHDLYSLVLAAIAFSALRCIAMLVYIFKRFKGSSFSIINKNIKEQFFYTLPYGITTVARNLSIRIHFFFIAFFYNTEMFAIYSIGAFQLPIIYVVNNAVSSIMIAETSRLQLKGEFNRIKVILLSAIRKVSLIYVPLFFFLFIAREEFITALFTEQYIESIPFFVANLFSILLLIVFVEPVFRAFPEHRYFRLRVYLLGLFLLPLSLFLFYKIMGAVGVVVGNVVVNLIIQIILFLKCYKFLKLSSSDIFSIFCTVGEIFLVSITACFPILLYKYLIHVQTALYALFVSTIIYAIAYVFLVYCFNLITKEEKQEIKDHLIKYWNRYGFGKLAK